MALTAIVTSDDGCELPPGSEGTILGIYNHGEAYVVEFAAPVIRLRLAQAGVRLANELNEIFR